MRHRLPQRVPVRRQGGVHQRHQGPEAEPVRGDAVHAWRRVQPDDHGPRLQVPLRRHRLLRTAMPARVPESWSYISGQTFPARVRSHLRIRRLT